MIHRRELIEALGRFEPHAWSGAAFRHMFAGFPPERENRSGARWNPPDTPAIYTSFEQKTALAEANYYIEMQPLRPKTDRLMYHLRVTLASVLDLSEWSVLSDLGVKKESFATTDYSASQEVGGAVEWLGHDGLLIPSARANGINLVIFPNQKKSDYLFEILKKEPVTE